MVEVLGFVGVGFGTGVVFLFVVGVVVVPVVLGVPPGVAAALCPVPEVLPLPEAGVVAGRVVSGVGSGGRGFDNTLAIISFNPSTDWL